MHTHPNARLTLLGRERMLRRHIDNGEPLAVVAAQVGLSLRSAYKWLARYRSGGVAALVAAPLSTVGRTLKAMGLGRLKDLQPAEPVRRYQ